MIPYAVVLVLASIVVTVALIMYLIALSVFEVVQDAL